MLLANTPYKSIFLYMISYFIV